MRELDNKKIIQAVEKLCLKINFNLPKDVLKEIQAAEKKEKDPLGQAILGEIIENCSIAAKDELPLCQDTGLVIVFAEIGEDLHLTGAQSGATANKASRLESAVNAGVKSAYEKGYLRKSTVENPLDRKNTNDNLPAIIHTTIVPGDRLTLKILLKGGGAENASRLGMLLPTAKEEEVINFVVETVKSAGAKACPPLVIGVGIGGNFEKCAILAKAALLRTIGSKPDKDAGTGAYADTGKIAALEKKILKAVNQTGIGPMGLGGATTALAVFVKFAPCHIAALPVAVNIECHSHRHGEVTL